MNLKDLSLEEWNILCDRVTVTTEWSKSGSIRDEFRDMLFYYRVRSANQRVPSDLKTNLTYKCAKQIFNIPFNRIPLKMRTASDFWLVFFRFRLEIGK